MTISVVDLGSAADESGSHSSLSITLASNIPEGSLIVVVIGEIISSGTIGDVIDSAGNSYTEVYTLIGGPNYYGDVFYCYNSKSLSSGESITYSYGTSGDYANISAFYATGILVTNPYDGAVLTYTTGAGAAPQTPSLTSGTPAIAGELFVAVAFCYSNNSPEYTQDSGDGWVSPPDNNLLSGTYLSAGGTQINAGTSQLVFAPTISTPFNTGFVAWSLIIISFKPAPAIPAIPYLNDDGKLFMFNRKSVIGY